MSSKITKTYDAVVIGAGPAGSTAALMLARAGWSVAIVEKSAFPRRKVCGEFVSATSLPLLFELGLGEAFQNLAGPKVDRVGLYTGDVILEAPMPRVASPYGASGRALGREHLDQLLLEAAIRAGAALWQPWTVRSVESRDSVRVCHLSAKGSSKTISSQLIIAAYGSWQPGPLPPRRGRINRGSDLLAFKAHFSHSNLPADLMPLLVFPGGYGGMVHSDGGRTSLSCCIRRDRLQSCRQSGSSRAAEAVLQHLSRSCRGVRQALGTAAADGAWLSAGPIRPGVRKQYQDGVFAVGNLAGEAHPVVAEGISMAIQSAGLLCRRLIDGKDRAMRCEERAEIGRHYTRDWRRSFETRIRVASAIAHLVMRPASVALWAPLLKVFPGILTLGAEMSGKTKLLPMLADVDPEDCRG